MKCPKCGFTQPDGAAECLKCGVIFSKLKPRRAAAPPSSGKPSWTDALEVDEPTPPLPDGGADAVRHRRRMDPQPHAASEAVDGYWVFFRELLFQEIADLGPQIQYARGALWILLLVATFQISFQPTSRINQIWVINMLHLVNLPFHEAGHIFFTPFGRFMQVLGGSLTQTLIPLVCLGGFLVAWRDPFAASVAWWWTGENLLDLAPYIDDARAGEMMLIGGITGRENPDFHDWKNLLMWTGTLKHDHTLAKLAIFSGTMMMISALCWGGYLIWRGLRARQE
ncbi:MAG: zinc ribbon domain-containing protein [Nitrospinota bacterium]|nr:zinc ribbon domain-containing protein [Nitrospinota bacterium]